MIISKKYKYIFIGLPYSASSAISKELIEIYEGEVLYHKHANIPLLLNQNPNFNINEYYVFAVIRNPVDKCFSVYNKFLTNPYGIYTDQKYFIENGGFVNKKARDLYQIIQTRKWSFEEYMRNRYNIKLYNDHLSVNNPFINGFIDFNDLSNGFDSFLNIIEQEKVRSLPVYNKTNKINSSKYLPDKLYDKIFLPYLNYNKKFFNKSFNAPGKLNKINFKIQNRLWNAKVMKYDVRQMNNKFSIEDLKNER